MYILLSVIFSQTPTPNIINGVDTDISEYASSLSMQTLGQHFCGAVLISEQYALSAAHCFDALDFSGVVMAGGKTNLDSNGGKSVFVESAYLHASYDANRITNDIAVIKLGSPLNFEFVDFTGTSIAVNEDVTSVGWGLTSPNGRPSKILQSTEQRVYADNSCSAQIIGSVICTKSPTLDTTTCNGDSGGGLYDISNKVAGVLSYGYEGCPVDGISVYTDVSYYKDFVCCYSKNTAVFDNTQCNIDLDTCQMANPAVLITSYANLIFLFPVLAGAFALSMGTWHAWDEYKQYSMKT
ncbi:serine protease [Emiliania huxleyi virus 202]|nr:serine protease [Emiliania huxleyi virus 202]AHA54528.1 putative serine protease [Emiliania huxleyi virus 18]